MKLMARMTFRTMKSLKAVSTLVVTSSIWHLLIGYNGYDYQYDNDGCDCNNASDVYNGHIGSNGNNGCITVIPISTVMDVSFSILVFIVIVAHMNRLAVIAIKAVMAIIAVITALAVTVMMI